MDRRIILTTLAAAVMGMVGLWLVLSLNPSADPPGPPRLPWDVSRSASAQTQVFGLTLGESRLADLRQLLKDEGKLSLFIEPDGKMSVEAFFKDVTLSGIRSDWVVSLQQSMSELNAIHQRGLRISTLRRGTRKVTLAPEDIERLTDASLRSITYLPWQRLEARDITGNFGEASQRIREDTHENTGEEHAIVHWLYPDIGVDIARKPDGAVVIQYLNPADFQAARARLLPSASVPSEPETPLKPR